MSDYVSIFQSTIATKFHISPDDNVIMIREEKVDAKCQWVKIKFKNTMANFCFSIDKQREKGELDPVFPFFNVEQSGLCTKNDAILICQKNAEIYVLLIELKSGDKGSYLQQLNSAKVFINFVVDRLNSSNNPDFYISKEKLNFRGLLFRCRRARNEGATSKKHKVEYQNRNGLLVSEEACHQIYHLNQFLF